VVDIGSSRLRQCIENELGLAPDDPVTRGQLGTLVTLDCSYVDLGDIDGLRYATALTSLSLADSYTAGYENVSLEPLAALTELESLDLSAARGLDWTVLAPLTNLVDVDLSRSTVSTVDWLSGSLGLRDVRLNSTRVSDLTALEGKPLQRLELDETDVTDLDWLAATPGLAHVSLRWLGLEDIDFLSGLEELTFVNINSNEVTNLEPLESATGLVTLEFAGNDVDDLAVLAELPELREVNLTGNHVTDISVLASLANLEDWSAYAQESTLPDITACEIQMAHAGVNIDGTPLNLTPGRGVGDPDTFLVGIDGEVEIKATAYGYPFSVTYVAEVVGYSQPCAWPTEYLSTMKFPSTLVAGTIATIEIAEWGTRHEEPLYRWTLADGTVDAISRSVFLLESGVGATVTPSAVWYVDGMEKLTVTGPTLTVQGVMPEDLEILFGDPPAAGKYVGVYAPDLHGDATWSCQWLLNGVVATSSTNCSLILPTSAAGKTVVVRATISKPNRAPRTYETAPAIVLRSDWKQSTTGSVSGTAQVGKTVTAVPPTFSPTPTSYTYQWFRNDWAIEGATAKTYTLTAADGGAKISVYIYAHKDGYSRVEALTPEVHVNRIFTATPAPTISGTKAVGFTLTATRGTWSPAPTSYRYQWYRAGKAISGATKSTYKTVAADGGHTVTVRVTAIRSGYTTVSKTSASVTILKRLMSTPTPTVSGTAKVKATLTARTGVWGPGTVTKSYQWYRNGKAIAGATKSTYKVGVRDAYASITVKVTGKKSGYLTAIRTSKAIVPSGIKYGSCAALKTDYPGGVAKSTTIRGRLSTTFVSAKLYALNRGRDGDKDGWACE
jgi:hypothetical protein